MNGPSQPGWDREIDEQLRASELQYRSLFVDNPQPMWVYDPQTLRFLAVNDAALAQYGYSQAEFLEMTVDALRPIEVREAWKREAFSKPPRGPRRFSGPHCRKDGQILHVDTAANDIMFQGRPARVVLGIDVTEQRRAAQDLRRSEARFRALTELSADWFWEQDEHFRFVEIDGGNHNPLGIPPGNNILGRTRWELVGSVPAEGSWDRHRAQLERHEPFRDFELLRTAANGEQHILSLAGSPIFDEEGRFTGYRGIGRDITETRRAELALRESQRALAALMGNLPGMAYRCLVDADWTPEFVSEGAYELTGHRPEAFLGGGVRYAELIHPDDRDMAEDKVQAGMAEDKAFEITYRISTAQGGQKWVWERGSAVRGPAGEVIALEGFVSDITERKLAQEEVARLNAELEERVRRRTAQLEAANAELEAFSYSIAHDLRSPLTSIDGFSHMLDELWEKAAVGDRGRHYLQRIRAGVRQMSDLTDAMLSLAQLSRVKLRWEEVDLAAIARTVEANLRESEPDRDACVEVPDHLYAQGDPRLLTQVITNLMGNAWKFSASKPTTVIRVGSAPGENGEPVYFIADDGAGFDMAHASRLFGAFQRLHAPSEFEGTGIGLALVQKIILRHAGRIWADARPGDGATFYFTLSSKAPS
jgi:PAS domain S-box-containing protein